MCRLQEKVTDAAQERMKAQGAVRHYEGKVAEAQQAVDIAKAAADLKETEFKVLFSCVHPFRYMFLTIPFRIGQRRLLNTVNV
jgi:hypothetical protein